MSSVHIIGQLTQRVSRSPIKEPCAKGLRSAPVLSWKPSESAPDINPSSTSVPNHIHNCSSPSPSMSSTADEGKLSSVLTLSSWQVILLTVATTFPWAIVPIWDAIDKYYRTRRATFWRLISSTLLLVVSYVAAALVLVHKGVDAGSDDESIAIIVILIFNLWYVLCSARGWLQYVALHRFIPAFEKMQESVEASIPVHLHGSINKGIHQVLVSERLVNNELNSDTQFLNPWPEKGVKPNGNGKVSKYSTEKKRALKNREIFACATWRAWWTQDISILEHQHELTALACKCDPSNLHANVEDLVLSESGTSDHFCPRSYKIWYHCRSSPVANFFRKHFISDSLEPRLPPGFEKGIDRVGATGTPKERWVKKLALYSTKEGYITGQQDTHHDSTFPVMVCTHDHIIALLVEEKTLRKPNRISALWHNTARFERVYEDQRLNSLEIPDLKEIVFPSWGSWLQIAQDISANLDRPAYLSDSLLVNYAGELAASSVILVRYPDRYKKLVYQIYRDGLNARWIYGWSGLLSCFTTLWTVERIFFAMLNGLSLIALLSAGRVEDIDLNVRAMLYGYAAFAVSDRAVGERIKDDQHRELARRYENEGPTFRGYGLDVIRKACKALGIPREVRYMDGPPALSAAWAKSYMEGKSGVDPPAGQSHREINRLLGSSTAWRFPARYT